MIERRDTETERQCKRKNPSSRLQFELQERIAHSNWNWRIVRHGSSASVAALCRNLWWNQQKEIKMLQQPQVAKGGKQLAAGQSTLSSELPFYNLRTKKKNRCELSTLFRAQPSLRLRMPSHPLNWSTSKAQIESWIQLQIPIEMIQNGYKIQIPLEMIQNDYKIQIPLEMIQYE